jgi:hypothetical protein
MSRVSRGIHLIVTKECLDHRFRRPGERYAQCCFASRLWSTYPLVVEGGGVMI